MKCKVMNVLAVLFCLVFIVACGGGGSSNFSDGDSTPTNTSDDPTSDADDTPTDPGDVTVQLGSMVEGVFTEGKLVLGLEDGQELAAEASTTVTVTLVTADGELYTEPVDVYFTSDFATDGDVVLTDMVTSENGVAVATYRAKGGEGKDTITAMATLNGVELTATVTIDVDGADVGSIDFISATPEFIALKGTGGPPRSETSVLVFKVVDIFGKGVPNQTINFELSTEIGGLFLSNTTATSNSEGLATTTVNAGNVSTHIRVLAYIPNSYPLISVVSDKLLVSTGLPDQNSITAGPVTLNPEVWLYDNVNVEIVFQAADHFNNFVPDGTVVYFTTKWGAIDDSCSIKDGVCSVIWRSGNPRPGYDEVMDDPDKALVSILAFCIGEESFSDMNGNGFFDAEDIFDVSTDRAEPFRDDDGNGIRDSSEPWWDFNDNGIYDSEPNGIYNGTLCSDSAEEMGLCTTELVYVQDPTITFAMSNSYANISFSQDIIDLRGDQSQTVWISVSDTFGNPLPMGTKILVTTSNGSIASESNFTIPNTLQSPHEYPITLRPFYADNVTSGFLEVTVTSPNGRESRASIPVFDDPLIE